MGDRWVTMYRTVHALDPELPAAFCRSCPTVNVKLAQGKKGFITTCLARA